MIKGKNIQSYANIGTLVDRFLLRCLIQENSKNMDLETSSIEKRGIANRKREEKKIKDLIES